MFIGFIISLNPVLKAALCVKVMGSTLQRRNLSPREAITRGQLHVWSGSCRTPCSFPSGKGPAKPEGVLTLDLVACLTVGLQRATRAPHWGPALLPWLPTPLQSGVFRVARAVRLQSHMLICLLELDLKQHTSIYFLILLKYTQIVPL